MFYLSGVDKLVQFDSEKSQMHGLRIRKKSVSEKAFDSPSHANSTCYQSYIYQVVLIPSTLNIDLILWHTQLIVCATV